MNHGSLGFLNEFGELSLKSEIINGLCLGNNSMLYGIYYPCPEIENSLYTNVSLKHDLMLTPIPSRFWPVSARIYIHLNQCKGSFNHVCDYLRRKGISIIHGESTRSAFRYATWSAHIVFENLLKGGKKGLTYNSDKNYYKQTFRALQDLIKTMNSDSELKNSLFTPDCFQAVDGFINAPLAYFNNLHVQRDKMPWIKEKWIVEPFKLTLDNKKGYEYLVGDDTFQSIISYIKKEYPGSIPAVTFSELHTRSLIVRNVLIPREDSKRFFMVGMEYERVGGTDSCVGIIHTITDKFPSTYNIWQSYTYTINSSEKSDKGNLVFLLENTANTRGEDNRSKESYSDEAWGDINKILTKVSQKVTYDHLKVVPLPEPDSFSGMFENNYDQVGFKRYKYDVFISYSSKDKKYVDDILKPVFDKYKLKIHVDTREIAFGSFIERELFSNILNSCEMCVVVSPKSNKSDWVISEGGAAWILNKILTPIRLSKTVVSRKLASRVWVDGNSPDALEIYVKQVLKRKLENDANRFYYHFGK